MHARFTAVAAIVVLLAMAAPVAAAEARPASGRFTAQAAPAVQRCGSDALTLGFEIEGVATHLGTFTGSGSNCTEFTLATSAVAIWDGQATFTAADGSTLTTTSIGSQSAPIAGLAEFLVVHDITGGTGRFVGAAGQWTVTGVLDFTTGRLVVSMTGWMSY